MEPSSIAKTLFNRITNYCKNNYDQPLECIVNHNPKRLSLLMYLHITDKDNELREALKNSDEKSWKSIQEEYEKLWKAKMVVDIGSNLGNILNTILENIMKNNNLNNNDKAKYLEDYYWILDKLYYKIKYALQDLKPLSKEVLHDWYMDIADTVSMTNSIYDKGVWYFLDFYRTFNDNDKLQVLRVLLNKIYSVIEDIDKNYGALTMCNLNSENEVIDK